MFTKEELQALQKLLLKTTISGGEAITVVVLQSKIQKLLEPETKPEENKKVGEENPTP